MADKATEEKRKRTRSPAYPFINLETAIKRAKQFLDEEDRSAAPLKVAVKHWGYEEKSSGGLQTAAALINFGLMRDEGTGASRKLKLTERALQILLDPRADSFEKREAIRGAALTPKVHQQLWRKWGNKTPSHETMKHMLVLELKPPFTPEVADKVIKEYQDTITFAKPPDSSIVPLAGGDMNAELENDLGEVQNPESQQPLFPTGSKPLGSRIPVSENCTVSIIASGEVTQKGISQLIAYLNLIKGSFPEG